MNLKGLLLKGSRVWLAVFCLVVLGNSIFAMSWAAQKRFNDLDILIIYSSGIPLDYYTSGPLFQKMREETSRGIDAVTTATPLKENCRTIANKLCAELEHRGLAVRVVEATEIEDYEEILVARLIVIGTPSRFWNVSWEIKKLFDEQFSRIAVLEEEGLGKRRIGAFSMAEISPSAEASLKAVNSMVNDCNGRFGPTMIFLVRHSGKEIKKRIFKFADRLSNCLKRE